MVKLEKDLFVITSDEDVPTVELASTDLVKGEDYELVGDISACGAGTYSVYVVGKGNYSGKVKLTWTVTEEHYEDRTFKHSVSLKNNLAINFYVSADGITEANDITLEALNQRTGNTETLTGTLETVGGAKMYKFSYTGIAAVNAGDIIVATPVIKLSDGTEYRFNSDGYSIAEYCYSVIEKSTTNAKLKTLAVDLLNFCSAVQTYAKSTEPLVNADLTPEQQALGTQGDLNLTSVEDQETLEGATASFAAKTVVVGNNISLKYFVDLSNVENIENVTITLKYAGKEKTFTYADFGKGRSTGEYTLTYSELPVNAFSEPIEAVVYENGEAISGKFTYSIESYAAAILEKSTNESMKKVVDTMMRYAASANAY